MTATGLGSSLKMAAKVSWSRLVLWSRESRRRIKEFAMTAAINPVAATPGSQGEEKISALSSEDHLER
jgi:hypothetical protein